MAISVAVVGYCASGKTSIVKALQEWGIEAYSVAQEHSAIADLWNHQRPDYLIFLDVTLEELRRRRDNPRWPEWIYRLQTTRLEPARQHADLVVDTSDRDLNQVIRDVREQLAGTASP